MKFLKYLFKTFFFETLPMGLALLAMVVAPLGLMVAGVLGILTLGEHLLGEDLFGTVIQIFFCSLLALLALVYVVDYIKKEYKGFKQQQEYKKHIEAYKKNYEEDEE